MASPPDPIAMLVESGVLPERGSPTTELLEEAARKAYGLGLTPAALTELAQAWMRGVARIAAAEASAARRFVEPDDLDAWVERASQLAREVFAQMHADLLTAALGAAQSPTDLTVAFVDLRGSTRFVLEQPADAIRALSDQLFAVSERVAHAYGLSVVKYLGDGVILLGSDAAAVVTAAREAVRELGEHTPLRAAAGVVTGRVIAHAGDCFGPAVNLASRLAELAAADEVLVQGGLAGEERVVTPRGLETELVVSVATEPSG